MPEVAAAEKNDVVFFGYVADDQTKFVVTRAVENQITFRLPHPVLPRLQASAKKIVRRILVAKFLEQSLVVGNSRIVVYERGYDDIIITGRVISHPLRETRRTSTKDLLLTIVPLLLLVPLTVLLIVAPSAITAQPTTSALATPLIHGTLERMSTALLTTALVSGLGLLTTYYDIKKNRSIAWDVARDSNFDEGLA